VSRRLSRRLEIEDVEYRGGFGCLGSHTEEWAFL
jgi:hypothetical protein